MWYNQLKTTVLLAALAGIFMLIGGLIGGNQGIITAFIFSLAMNAFAYFFSDKLVLNMYNAQPLDPKKFDWIYDIVNELANKNNMPMPKLWLVQTPMANAFATGRNPKHASVAVTTGILDILNKDELRGVLAHELSHVTNRDILVSSIAATLASAITFLANMTRYAAMWGTPTDSEGRRGLNPIFLLIAVILMPIAASLIQLAISRSREYLADESGAEVSHDPLALASALKKLQTSVAQIHLADNDTVHATTAHLFIVYPFSGKGLTALFSTHPPMEKRIERLMEIHRNMIGQRHR